MPTPGSFEVFDALFEIVDIINTRLDFVNISSFLV